MEAVRNIDESISGLEYELILPNAEMGIEFDIYDLHSTETRIQSLETLLCYLVKHDKPIDSCLKALNHLKSDCVKKVEKPKQTIPQIVAESIHNGFAVVGMFLFLLCAVKSNEIKSYSPNEAPVIEQGELKRVN